MSSVRRRLLAAIAGSPSGLSRLQIVSSNNLAGSAAEAGLTYGGRFLITAAMTAAKMGVVPKTSGVGSSVTMRLGIWSDSGSTLLASTAQTAVTLSRTDPTMLDLNTPVTLAPGGFYWFGLYISAGNGSLIDGSSGEGSIPVGAALWSNARAVDGFAKPDNYAITNVPAIVLAA